MNQKSKKLINNTFIFVVGSIGSKFIQFFLVPLYTYTLSTAQYGVTELVLTAANLCLPIFSVSISDGLLRFGLDKTLNKACVIKNALIIVAAGSILSVCCIPVFSLNKTLSEWIIFFLLIMNLRTYRDVFAINLKINDKNKLFTLDSILYTFELCGFSVLFLACFKWGIVGYFWAYVVANALSIVFLVTVGKPFHGMAQSKIDRNLLLDLLRYSIPMILNGIAWWITNASDRFMLQWLMTDSDVGIYSVAAKIPAFVTTFTGVFNQAWVISAVVEYDSEQEKNFYSETFHRYYFLLFIASACLIAVVKPFMSLYVSNDYFSAWQYCPFLLCSSIVSGISAFTSGIYAATKKNTDLMTTTLIGATVNIILNYFLIKKIGIMGAAIATYFSWAVIAIVRVLNTKRIFEFQINYFNLILYSVLTLIQCLAVTYCGNYGYPVSIAVIAIIIIRERKTLKRDFSHMIKKIRRNDKHNIDNNDK